MKVVALLLALVVAVAVASDIIPNEYVIQLRNGLTADQLSVHVKYMKANFSGEAFDNAVLNTINMGEHFKAVHARLSPRMVAWALAHPDVMVVEPNRVFTASAADCFSQEDAIWNLARVDERSIDLVDTQYTWDNDASNVDVYVIDTGVQINHVEFGGRAYWGTNTADSRDEDCNGHGTHVAGTIAGKQYGLAKGARVFAVKVLACSGSGTTAGVALGVEWANSMNLNQTQIGRRGVGNMSLGGGKSTIIDNAVEAAIKNGLTMVVAAGNDNANACNYSPASAPNAITVGATTLVETVGGLQEDRRSSFSNYGSCVDIFAPGQLIKAAWIGSSNTATNTISGTSMASPHVAGVVALVLGRAKENLSPKEVSDLVYAAGTRDVVDLNCSNSVCNQSDNNFLYTACAEN